jgi:hypothetical protein
MLEQQWLLASLTEQEYRHWCEHGQVVRLKPGETLIGADDFPDLYLVLEGRFVVNRHERSPGIVGLDEFLTGWMTDREWMADQPMTLFMLDSGRFGQVLSIDPRRRRIFHQGLLPLLAGRLYRDLEVTERLPGLLSQGFERGVQRFENLRIQFECSGR